MVPPVRTPRALDVTPVVRRQLAQLRRLQLRPGEAPELEAERVSAVEAALGCVFADDVLAVMATDVDELREQSLIDLARVVRWTQEARRRGCPDDLVAIGRHPDGIAFYCVNSRATEDEPVGLHDFDNLDHHVSVQPLADWLGSHVEARRDFLAGGDEDQRALAEARIAESDVDVFRPMLV